MRLNVAPMRPKSQSLLKHWVGLLAEEFDVGVSTAFCWVKSNTDFTAEFLQTKGWIIHSYTTPSVGDRCHSYGYVIDDTCDEFVQWKLSQP